MLSGATPRLLKDRCHVLDNLYRWVQAGYSHLMHATPTTSRNCGVKPAPHSRGNEKGAVRKSARCLPASANFR